MATVRVRRDDYEDGVLPEVCVRTGAPAELMVDHRSIRGLGAWGVLFLLLGPVGLVAWVLVDRLLRREAHGMLPVTRAAREASLAARRRWDAVVWAGVAAAAVGVLLLLAGDGWRTASAVLISVGLAVALIAWVGPASLQPHGTPDRDGRWIEISGVSSEFARAYEAQDARRTERRRTVEREAGSPSWSPSGSTGA
jgi:hypothetical protein